MSNELSSEDVQNLISESEHLRKIKTYKIGKLEIDEQSFWVSLISLIFWCVIWWILGMRKIINSKITFAIFISYFVVVIINIINSATDVPDSAAEREKQASQQNFIQGGSAIYILVLVFLYNIQIDDQIIKNNIYKVLLISLILISISTLIINLKNESMNIRIVRKIQQSLYNQGTILFIFALILIFKSLGNKKV